MKEKSRIKYFYEIDGSDCLIYEDPEDEPIDVIDLHEFIQSVYKGAEAI